MASSASSAVVDSGFVGAIGLALDIVGAFFLARSFVVKKKADMARDNGSYWDGNPYQLRSACYQSVDARLGMGLLLLGFGGQFFYDTDVFPSGPTHYAVPTLVVGATLLLLGLWATKRISMNLSRRLVSQQIGSAVMREIEKFRGGGNANADSLFEFYGSALDLSRKKGESTADYATRLEGVINGGS